MYWSLRFSLRGHSSSPCPPFTVRPASWAESLLPTLVILHASTCPKILCPPHGQRIQTDSICNSNQPCSSKEPPFLIIGHRCIFWKNTVMKKRKRECTMQILEVLALRFHARTVNTPGTNEGVVKHPDKVTCAHLKMLILWRSQALGFLSQLQLFPHLHPSR